MAQVLAFFFKKGCSLYYLFKTALFCSYKEREIVELKQASSCLISTEMNAHPDRDECSFRSR